MLSWFRVAALIAVWERCKFCTAAAIAGAGGDSNAAARALLQASCPMFEAFWQGRLIPGARIDSLPFIEVSYCLIGDRLASPKLSTTVHKPNGCNTTRMCTTKWVQITVCTTHMDVIYWMNLVLLGY